MKPAVRYTKNCWSSLYTYVVFYFFSKIDEHASESERTRAKREKGGQSLKPIFSFPLPSPSSIFPEGRGGGDLFTSYLLVISADSGL